MSTATRSLPQLVRSNPRVYQRSHILAQRSYATQSGDKHQNYVSTPAFMPGFKYFVWLAVGWCVGGVIWSYSPPFLTSTSIGEHAEAKLREDKIAMDAAEGEQAHQETGAERRKEERYRERQEKQHKQQDGNVP